MVDDGFGRQCLLNIMELLAVELNDNVGNSCLLPCCDTKRLANRHL